MIQRETGNVVHIDFGEVFEANLKRKEWPEKVPFRLTRMIENALEGSNVKGFFTKMCETVIRAVRGARWALEAVLAIFIDQPAVPSKTNVKASLMRVGEKLQGQVGGTLMSVEEQVEQLINEARDPKNYVRHYLGWCPFW